jgi:signal transduction histidine kinase
MGMAQLLKGSVEPDSEIAEGLDDIIADAKRVAEVVDVLLKLSQSQVAPEMQVVDTGDVIRSVLTMFATRIEEGRISVQTRLAEKCQVFARENDLRLVLRNLLDNAVAAVPEGGEIEIEAAVVEGGAVRITVADDGPGMTEEVRLRALDPFFTTGAPGSGARGLGLSLVHQLVTEHDGRVVIESSPGFGARVTIYLTGAAELSRA